MTKARDLANSAAAFASVSATELGYVDGVTSAIQTQMDAKAPSSTAVTLTGTQTLTNKTLTNPVIASVINNTLTSTTGDIIYASAANTPARLGIGTTGQVLNVASGLPAWGTASSGLTLISTTTMSAVSTQAFNSVFSSTYTNYMAYMNISMSAGGKIYFYWRASGTNNTSGNYNWCVFSLNRNGTTSVTSNGSDVIDCVIAPDNEISANATTKGQFNFQFYSPFAANTRQAMTWAANGGNATGWIGEAMIQGYTGTAFDGFAITPSTGTISGTVSIYGVAK